MHGDFQIDEAGVVHEHQAGFVFSQPFHARLLTGEAGGQQVRDGNQLQQRTEKPVWPQGRLVGPWGQGNDLLIGQGGGFDLHMQFLSLVSLSPV